MRGECTLQLVERARLRQALHADDVRTIRLHCVLGATAHGTAVDHDGAGPANAVLAADMNADRLAARGGGNRTAACAARRAPTGAARSASARSGDVLQRRAEASSLHPLPMPDRVVDGLFHHPFHQRSRQRDPEWRAGGMILHGIDRASHVICERGRNSTHGPTDEALDVDGNRAALHASQAQRQRREPFGSIDSTAGTPLRRWRNRRAAVRSPRRHGRHRRGCAAIPMQRSSRPAGRSVVSAPMEELAGAHAALSAGVDCSTTLPPVTTRRAEFRRSGSACATDPPSVPRLRVWKCPTHGSAIASSGTSRADDVGAQARHSGRLPAPVTTLSDAAEIVLQRGDARDIDDRARTHHAQIEHRPERHSAREHRGLVPQFRQQSDRLRQSSSGR